MLLSNDIVGDFAVDVGESKIPSGVLVSQFLVIQTQKVKDGGMEVMEVHAVFHRSHAVLIIKLEKFGRPPEPCRLSLRRRPSKN